MAHEGSESASESTKGPSERHKSGMKLESMQVRRAKNGGYIATVHMESTKTGGRNAPPMSYQSEDYVFEDLDKLLAFQRKEFA